MLLKIGARNLFRNKRRTLNILLTVAFGTASLFLFHGFNSGVLALYRDGTIKTRWGNGIVTTAGYREALHEKPWEHWIDKPEELSGKLLEIPHVDFVFPRIEFFAMVSSGDRSYSARGQGIDGPVESQFFTSINFTEGENLSTQNDGIILGQGIAQALQVKVGDRVTLLANTIHGSLNGADVVVTGIFHTGMKEFDDSYFRIQLPIAQTLLDTQSVESISLGLDSFQNWSSVESRVETLRPDLEATPFNIIDKVYYQHSVDWLQAQFKVFQTIVLAVVILGIFNTVSTSVLERRQELGNLRANGESSGEVFRLLITEGFFMGLCGGFLGLFLGGLIAWGVLSDGITMPPAPGITRVFKTYIQLQPMMALQTFAMGLGACVVATALASISVVRQPITDLLRST